MMKHEKYFTYDGSVSVWPVETKDIASMAYLIEKRACHMRGVVQKDGTKLGLMALRTNKDDLGVLSEVVIDTVDIFNQVLPDGFTRIVKGTENEKHGKHSWDKHDAEDAIIRTNSNLNSIEMQRQATEQQLLNVDTKKLEFQAIKEKAIQENAPNTLKMATRTLKKLEEEKSKHNQELLNLGAEKEKEEGEKLKHEATKDKAQEALDALGG